MLTLNNTSHKSTEQILKCSATVAEHYGFLPLETIMPEYGTKRRRIPQYKEYSNEHDDTLASIIRSYIEHEHTGLTEPTLLYQSNVSKNQEKVSFGLHILGAPHSVAEAILIKTALATLDDLGISTYKLYINSVGDKDSIIRFTKELTLYLRKNINDIPESSRQAMKEDVLYAYQKLLKKQHQLCASAPSTVEFLTEVSRQHLREILEYLEVAEVDYELDPTIMGHQDCCCHTLFEIRDVSKDEGTDDILVFARGGRYDELSRKAFRQHIPATSIVFEYEKKGRISKTIPTTKKRVPKFYFIQLGFEARLRSLSVIETLRKARIPVYQSLGKNQLGEQLELADELEIPYCIIMGHKEALEKTVIVRHIDSRAQNIIPIENLPTYLKSI